MADPLPNKVLSETLSSTAGFHIYSEVTMMTICPDSHVVAMSLLLGASVSHKMSEKKRTLVREMGCIILL